MKTRKRRREEDSERQELLAKIARGRSSSFKDASEEMRGDFDVALVAVEKIGRNLAYASKQLQNNPKVVLAAVHKRGLALQYASPTLQANHDVVMAAVCKHGGALRYASLELQANQEIVETAVQNCGYALKYASPELRANRDMVHAALQNHGASLEFASQDLRADKALVLTAVRNTSFWEAFKYATVNLQSNHDFVARAITAAAAGGESPYKVLPFVSDAIKSELEATASKFETVGQAQVFLHDSVHSRNALMEFLCCVTSKAAAVAGNPVTLLNLDKVTSEKLHRHIAEYQGVPLDQELIESVRLVKRVMPILEASFRDRNNDDLAWLLQEIAIEQ